MTNNNQFAIVPVPQHPGHASDFVKSDAILVGPFDEAMLAIKNSVSAQALCRRIDEGQRVAAATERQQQENRTRQILTFCDSVGRLKRRLDQYEAELAIQREREAEEAARQDELRIKHKIDALPDPDDPKSWGDLSTPIPPPEKHEPDSLGDLPEGVLEQAPSSGGFANYPTMENPPKKQVSQPISVSLNTE